MDKEKENIVDEIHDISLMLKGFSFITDVYTQKKDECNMTPEQNEAVNYFISSSLLQYSNLLENQIHKLW